MPECECSNPWFPDKADIQQDSSAAGEAEEDFSGEPFKRGVSGRVIDTSGDETFRGRQIDAHVSHVYETRYFAGVLPTMRLKITAGMYKDRILNIEYVKVIRKQNQAPMQWLYCKELVGS